MAHTDRHLPGLKDGRCHEKPSFLGIEGFSYLQLFSGRCILCTGTGFAWEESGECGTTSETFDKGKINMKRAILVAIIALMLSACAGANQYESPTEMKPPFEGSGIGSY
ncbi:MAG: hypothetical protein NTU74_02290 [Deltaproteobacteria bacterium]|nr:hypothetical protein [Deltaproteobacteria bacterium]